MSRENGPFVDPFVGEDSTHCLGVRPVLTDHGEACPGRVATVVALAQGEVSNTGSETTQGVRSAEETTPCETAPWDQRICSRGSARLDRLARQVRGGVRQILPELIEQEVTEALGRLRHGDAQGAKGYRAGAPEPDLEGRVRTGSAVGTAGTGETGADGCSREFLSALLTRQAPGSFRERIDCMGVAGRGGYPPRAPRAGCTWTSRAASAAASRASRSCGSPSTAPWCTVRIEGHSTAPPILVAVRGGGGNALKVPPGLRTRAAEREPAGGQRLQDLESQCLKWLELAIIDRAKAPAGRLGAAYRPVARGRLRPPATPCRRPRRNRCARTPRAGTTP